jgi:hypothetical protein
MSLRDAFQLTLTAAARDGQQQPDRKEEIVFAVSNKEISVKSWQFASQRWSIRRSRCGTALAGTNAASPGGKSDVRR